MRFITALFLALCLFTSSAPASDSWIAVGKTDRSHFYAYRGSLSVAESSTKQRVFYVIGKYEILATKESVLQVWYVSVQDCIRSTGKLYVLDVSGQPVTDIEFKPGDNSVGHSIAKLICDAGLGSLTDSKNRI